MTPQDRRGKHFIEGEAAWLRSDKTQCFSLLFPVQREAGIAHQAGGRELWRLAAIKNGFRDIRGEERESHDLREIGILHSFVPGYFPEARAAARDEFFPQGMRPDDEPDQAGIGACHSPLLPIDEHLHLLAGALETGRNTEEQMICLLSGGMRRRKSDKIIPQDVRDAIGRDMDIDLF